jgi:nucleotide-binding universal stress UspA family protein
MFHKILYPTDFSDVSAKGLAFVERLQEAGTKEVVVFHVIDLRHFDALISHDSTFRVKAIVASLETAALDKLNAVADSLRDKGFTVKVRLGKGIPFHEILKAADEEEVSAIVIGSHGVSNVEEMFLGSVSEKVIRKSKQTVLVVKREETTRKP